MRITLSNSVCVEGYAQPVWDEVYDYVDPVGVLKAGAMSRQRVYGN